jgi:hypothetical protein
MFRVNEIVQQSRWIDLIVDRELGALSASVTAKDLKEGISGIPATSVRLV